MQEYLSQILINSPGLLKLNKENQERVSSHARNEIIRSALIRCISPTTNNRRAEKAADTETVGTEGYRTKSLPLLKDEPSTSDEQTRDTDAVSECY
jgi:hypothetical protein